MSNYAVAIEWVRCPDGAVIASKLPETASYYEQLHEDFQHPGDVEFRTARRETYPLRADGTGGALILKYLAAKTDQQLVDFVSEYGFPEPMGGVRDEGTGEADPLTGHWQRMKMLRNDRDMLAQMIELFEDSPAEVIGYFQRLSAERMASLRPGLVLRPGSEKPTLSLTPQTLLGYMVLEVGLILTGNNRIATCPWDGVPFLAGAYKGKRTTAVYCSNRCRVAAQRARKAQMTAEAVEPAKELHAPGRRHLEL